MSQTLKHYLERCKVLANLAYDGGVQIALETYEDGMADTRETGASAFVVLAKNSEGHRLASEFGDHPDIIVSVFLARLEEAAVAKLTLKHNEAANTRKKTAAAIQAIKEGKPLP